MDHCGHVLSVLTRSAGEPKFWLRPEYKQIRECVEVIKSHPAQFLPVVGDQLPMMGLFLVRATTKRRRNRQRPLQATSLPLLYLKSYH